MLFNNLNNFIIMIISDSIYDLKLWIILLIFFVIIVIVVFFIKSLIFSFMSYDFYNNWEF